MLATILYTTAAVAATVVVLSFTKFKKYLPFFSYEHVPELDNVTSSFVNDFKKDATGDDNARRDKYKSTTETFYNLITDFYEYGWGESFHFAPRYKSETFRESILRYEHWFAKQIDAKPGMKVVDIGCGIGGPMRGIAQYSNAHITGVNITKEHIQRAIRYNKRAGVKNCNFIQADFNEIPVEDNTFDAGYDMEATLHSTDRKRTFSEIYRILKPGAKFITAQYCIMDGFDENNPEHHDIIRRVDNTNGSYCAGYTVAKTRAAIKAAGFEILSDEHVFDNWGTIPYHEVFKSQAGGRFAGTKLGRSITSSLVWLGESLRLLPRGTVEVQQMLVGAADSFQEAGDLNLLTPGYVFVLRKPLAA